MIFDLLTEFPGSGWGGVGGGGRGGGSAGKIFAYMLLHSGRAKTSEN